ncbi:hypothetical protein D8L93_10815 [Sodalis-like symbiont of Bactericera trigonica]|nr:hypothetical protein D8L93_10815 [Sodalis-like symbiont of Bactericera trigonica]
MLARALDSGTQGNLADNTPGALLMPSLGSAPARRHRSLCLPLRRGYSTVYVVIVTHNDLPLPETIKSVQSYIDEMRPVTSKDCLVLTPRW